MTKAMTPDLHEAVLAELPSTTALNPGRGPAPVYRPHEDWPQVIPLPPEHPNWKILDQTIAEAWGLGITMEEINEMCSGTCPAQIASLITHVGYWIEAHRSSAA